MAPKRTAAAATPGSASDASDGEEGAARHGRRRRASPSPTPSRSRSRSRSRSKSPPSNLRPSAAALSFSPISAGADFAAASDSDADNGAGGRAPSSRRINRERPGPEHLDSDADADADADAGTGGRVPSPRRRGERSPSFHTDSDADAESAGRVPSPRRNRERTPRPHSDSDSDNSAAGAASEEDDAGGDASPLPRGRRSSNIKPVRASPMDVPGRAAAGSSQRRSKRRHSHYGRPSPERRKRHPRVWSPKDEITILSALINYRAKKGHLPASIQDTSKVHSQISARLTANASTTQLSDKVRRLKHKYKLLMTRAENGGDPDLPTDHDRDVYELCKKVWGFRSGDHVGGFRAYEDSGAAESDEEQGSDEDMENGWERRERMSKKPKTFRFENDNGNAIVTVGRASHGNVTGRDDTEEGKQVYPYLWEAVEELSKEHPSGPIFRKAFGILEKSKARAMEEKLRKFRMSEIRQQLRRMDLMKEIVGMVLDALEGAF